MDDAPRDAVRDPFKAGVSEQVEEGADRHFGGKFRRARKRHVGVGGLVGIAHPEPAYGFGEGVFEGGRHSFLGDKVGDFVCGAEGLCKLRHENLLEKEVSRSEEHTSELQSLMRISYAVFCLKQKNNTRVNIYDITSH